MYDKPSKRPLFFGTRSRKKQSADRIAATSSSERITTTVDGRSSYDPLTNYYLHRIENNVEVFYRFALQTNSVVIREAFAKAATGGRLGTLELLSYIERAADLRPNRTTKTQHHDWDSRVLLYLSDLIANTAQNDLDTQAALQIYDFTYSQFGKEEFSDQSKLQYVEALAEVGRYKDLDELSVSFNIDDIAPLQTELLHIQRTRQLHDSPDKWLEALNQLYARHEMSLIECTERTEFSLLDRLKSASTAQLIGPKVSVIMPTFSPGLGIKTALRSLLEQTWHNIEIIVVDDASPPEYDDIFHEIETMDPRIQVIRQEVNAGAYVARNAGLEYVSGEFITTQDDDDWSHPDKIAVQVQSLINDSSLQANTSAHIRTTENMEFRRVNMHAKFLQMNYSSLMFRRSVIEDIGKWDTVNRGGDSEFILRISEYYGKDSVLRILDRPLQFSRVWTGSLTSGEMSRGYFSYSRLLYRWSFRQWHWDTAKQGKKAIRTKGSQRPYAVPTTFETSDRNKDLGLFDVVYVTDFFRQAKFSNRVVQEMAALQESGLRVGYMHMYSPQTNRAAGIPKELFELQRQGRLTQIGQDDRAETKLLLVYDAAIGMFLDEMSVSLVSQRSVLIDDSAPHLSGTEPRSPVLHSQSLKHLDRCFNCSFEVIGTSLDYQQKLSNVIPAKRLLSQEYAWLPHLREKPGRITAPSKIPRVGFHSYGNQYRWPSSVEEFENIYVSDSYETILYGHLRPAREKFGELALSKVRQVHFEEQTETEYLETIDFWVHYPNRRLSSTIWAPVINAMNAGKVVILPEHLQSIYGDSAVYATSGELSSTISRLASNPDLYCEQAKKGQEFVRRFFTVHALTSRVVKLTSST